MKNNIRKIAVLLLSLALVTSCKGVNRPTSGSDSSKTGVDNIDQIVKDFLKDTSVTMPSFESYKKELTCDVCYYYASKIYLLNIKSEDNGVMIEYLNTQLPGNTNLLTLNDDTYTVADYGYIWGDTNNSENMNVYLEYYEESGSSLIHIYRYDGTTGSIDASNVDTSWYVDYINFQGFSLSKPFPKEEIKTALKLEINNIPDLGDIAYPSLYVPAYQDSNGSYPDTYYIVLEGDQVQSYAAKLNTAGFVVEVQENVGEQINWETFQYEEYTYYTASAYDNNHKIFIDIMNDDSGNTIVCFNRFEDVRTDKKTTNTRWTDQQQLLMTESFGELLPFMAFGDDYELYDDSDEQYNVLCLVDTYYTSLADDYIQILLANGFKKDSTSYDDTCYYYDNGTAYIEVFADYYYGNYIEIYFEDSKLTPATSIRLDVSDVYIVPGASYQLAYTLQPENSFAKVTWSSQDNNLATVDQNGLVTIKENAPMGQTVDIYVTTATGLTSRCTFGIKENVPDDVWVGDASVIPGGAKVKLNYGVSPYGVSYDEEAIRFEIEEDKGLHVDQDGYVWADSTAVPGTEGFVTIIYGSGANTLLCDARITVVKPTVTHTLTREFFGIKEGYSTYATYTKTTSDGASYEAQCAGKYGLQIRSNNNNSGVIGHMEGRSCASITFTFDSNTFETRDIDVYASNTAFAIEDMYDGSLTKVGSVSYTQGVTTTVTYTFTGDYSYIGFRSNKNAIYLTSVEIVWR